MDVKRRKIRNVLVFPGANGEDDFRIDEDDHRVMKRLFKTTTMDATKSMVEIREEDEEHRVYKFRMPDNVDYLPEFILELDALEELTEAKINKFP